MRFQGRQADGHGWRLLPGTAGCSTFLAGPVGPAWPIAVILGPQTSPSG
jgi:hypothetical protein